MYFSYTINPESVSELTSTWNYRLDGSWRLGELPFFTIRVRVTITYDRDIIGKISPFNVCTVEFDASESVDEWECRATLASESHGVGIGVLINSGGSIANNVITKFNIQDTQLTKGDGLYRISVYVKKSNTWFGG